MIIFYSAFMMLLFARLVVVGLKEGNEYNLVSGAYAALAFWSGCMLLVAVA